MGDTSYISMKLEEKRKEKMCAQMNRLKNKNKNKSISGEKKKESPLKLSQNHEGEAHQS